MQRYPHMTLDQKCNFQFSPFKKRTLLWVVALYTKECCSFFNQRQSMKVCVGYRVGEAIMTAGIRQGGMWTWEEWRWRQGSPVSWALVLINWLWCLLCPVIPLVGGLWGGGGVHLLSALKSQFVKTSTALGCWGWWIEVHSHYPALYQHPDTHKHTHQGGYAWT